ncbi:hypothetical protein, partial [Periweissella ghanensis]|uniref:hypothetical protein n=1 Tax=Periweissella ghanensis TaxID=467997 RepID=UPI00202E4681
ISINVIIDLRNTASGVPLVLKPFGSDRLNGFYFAIIHVYIYLASRSQTTLDGRYFKLLYFANAVFTAILSLIVSVLAPFIIDAIKRYLRK